MKFSTHFWRFFAVSTTWHLVSVLVDFLFEDYDQSTALTQVDPLLRHAVKWDSLFFLEIIDEGYRWDKNHAFLPGIYFIGQVAKMLAGSYYLHLILLMGKTANFASMILIEKISLKLSNNDVKFSELVSSLFLLNPAFLFFNSLYTESFFTVCIFYGTWLFFKYEGRWQGSVYSAFWFGMATSLRANGVFYVTVSGFPILMRFLVSVREIKLREAVREIPLGLLVGCIQLIPYGIELYYPYRLYCMTPDQAAWCNDTLPNIYSYVQNKYWRVGFMYSYYYGSWHDMFVGAHGLGVMGVWLVNWLRNPNNMRLSPLVLQQTVLFYICAFVAYVECSTRFFSTSVLFYWALADLYKNHKSFTFYYLFHFNFCSLVLFTNHLPWK